VDVDVKAPWELEIEAFVQLPSIDYECALSSDRLKFFPMVFWANPAIIDKFPCNLDFASFDVDAFLWCFRCSVAADFKEKYPTPCKWSFIPNCMGNAFAPFERLLLAFGVDMASVNALVSMLEEIILRGGDDGPYAADNVLREYLREAQELFKAFVGGARSLTQFVGPGENSAAGRAYTAFMESVVDKYDHR